MKVKFAFTFAFCLEWMYLTVSSMWSTGERFDVTAGLPYKGVCSVQATPAGRVNLSTVQIPIILSVLLANCNQLFECDPQLSFDICVQFYHIS